MVCLSQPYTTVTSDAFQFVGAICSLNLLKVSYTTLVLKAWFEAEGKSRSWVRAGGSWSLGGRFQKGEFKGHFVCWSRNVISLSRILVCEVRNCLPQPPTVMLYVTMEDTTELAVIY